MNLTRQHAGYVIAY